MQFKTCQTWWWQFHCLCRLIDSQSNTIYPKKSIYLENQKEHIAGMATSVVQLCDKSQMWHWTVSILQYTSKNILIITNIKYRKNFKSNLLSASTLLVHPQLQRIYQNKTKQHQPIIHLQYHSLLSRYLIVCWYKWTLFLQQFSF